MKMRTRLFSTIIGVLLMCSTIITVSAQAEIVLIDGLALGDRRHQGLHIPDKGGNSFIGLKQYKNNCGPTSVEMVSHYYGVEATLNKVWREGGIHNVDAGAWPGEIKQALNGLGIPSLWLNENSGNYKPFESLKSKIKQSRPPILLLRLGDTAYHYVVAVGYNEVVGDALDYGESYLLADPAQGDFRWISRQDLISKWDLSEDGNKSWSGVFNATVDFIGRTKPYTMIVPKEAPTDHFSPFWAQMRAFAVAGKVKLLGKTRNWTRTVTFSHPFDFYQIAMLRPLQWNPVEGINAQWGHSSISSSSKIGKDQVEIHGRIEDGWLTQGYAWVVVRAYSYVAPPSPNIFTVTGITNNESIPSGESRTITVSVRTHDNQPVPGLKVHFIDYDDNEISFIPSGAIPLHMLAVPRVITTNSSGEATATLYTGSSGSADFEIKVQDLGTRDFRVTVVPTLRKFWRTRTVEGTKQVLCLGIYTKWVTWRKYVDVEPGTIKDSVTVSEESSSKRARLSGWEWHDANTIKVWGRIRNGGCWLKSERIKFRVEGNYVGTADPRREHGAPPLTPELDTLSAYWQDLSQVPLETDLLTNYPNPFNPETWIPYQLAEPAEVHISIYAANGKLVKSLPIGYQSAGVYTSHSRAAHWDGKNEFGEPVASGIYFYTLTAGEFTATRKMLILK